MPIKPQRRPSGSNPSGARLTIDNLQDLRDAITLLADTEVLVGVPEEETERPGTADEPTNAALAYIHDNGAPEVNIPARPFMIPGINASKPTIVKELIATARAAARASQPKPGRTRTQVDVKAVIEKGLHRVGLTAQTAIRNKISEGIPPPLSDRTLRDRAARGRKGAAGELARRAKGEAPSMDGALPLMDTNEMLKSVSYAIRKKSARK